MRWGCCSARLARIGRTMAEVALLAVLATGCGDDDAAGSYQQISGSASTGSGGSGAAGSNQASSGSGQGAGGANQGGSGGDGGGGAGGGGFVGPIGGDRPVDVHVPPGYNPANPAPLLLLLHGYSAWGDLQEFYLQLTDESDERGFLYAIPNGTKDGAGFRFWNATDACCNFENSPVDDSTYLRGVIEDIQQVLSVDPKRIYLVGHSNGGFMSHRMACDHADKIAAIATLAGAVWDDASLCSPSEPVSVLNMHGTLDPVILYPGGNLLGNSYPSAVETGQTWAALNGCSATADFSPPNVNVSAPLLGNETQVRRWDIGCNGNAVVEHWKIVGAQHAPVPSSQLPDLIVDFLYDHPKP